MCSFHPRPRHLLFATPSLVFAIALGALCCLPGTADASQTAPPPTIFNATILGAEALDMDVVTHIEWSDAISADEPVLLSLTDRYGATVSSLWTLPVPGQTVAETLTGALENATLRPQHHDLHLTGDDGTQVAADHPLQVGLQCASPDVCEFKIRNGISAPEMVVLDGPLAAALEEAEAAGASDLLAWVAQSYPELIGDVYGMQWQLRSLGGTSQGQSGCSCFWTLQAEKEDTEGSGTCGGSHDLFYRRQGPDYSYLTQIVSGRSTMTADVGCWRLSQTETALIAIGSTEVAFQTTDIERCVVDCPGSTIFVGDYDVALAATTNTGNDRSSVLDGVIFKVDNVQVFWDLFGLISDAGVDRVDSHSSSGTMFSTPGATAEMSSGSQIWLEYAPENDAPSTFYGSVVSQSCGSVSTNVPCAAGQSIGTQSILVQGQSACTGSLTYLATSTFAANKVEGVGGDDIQILVGKCDG